MFYRKKSVFERVSLNLKRLQEFTPPPCGFSKNAFSRERLKPCFFVIFDIIISNIIPENFIEIPQVVHKIWRFSFSVLTIFINFLDFLILSNCNETNDISIKQMLSVFFYFQLTLNRLFNNYMKLY